MHKCELPDSRVSMMLEIKDKLSYMKNQENLLENKNSLITVRDLIKWGNRKDFLIEK